MSAKAHVGVSLVTGLPITLFYPSDFTENLGTLSASGECGETEDDSTAAVSQDPVYHQRSRPEARPRSRW